MKKAVFLDITRSKTSVLARATRCNISTAIFSYTKMDIEEGVDGNGAVEFCSVIGLALTILNIRTLCRILVIIAL
jgi:hypothetical protein